MILKEILEKVEQAKIKEIPFVMYKIPDADFIEAIIQKNKRLDYVVDFKESGFVMAPFDQHEKAVLFANGNVYRYQSPIPSESSLNLDKPLHKIVPGYPEASKEKHIGLVKKGIESIKNGDFIKAVLSRSEFVEIKEPDIIQIFLKLLAKYTEAFVYVWYHPKVGLWAGASPETLLRTKGNRFKTMSLAGTQKYRSEADATWGEKEVQEQQIVTDHLLDSLEGISVEINPTYTKKAGNLLHLCNDIQGVLDGKETLKQLIDRLHPTAAVCGFPKKKVQQFILKQEGYHRGFYTGFLGELNWEKEDHDTSKDVSSKEIESNLFVNLRCMQLRSEPTPGAIVYVGGGITAKSDPVLEWEETVDKSLVMKSVLLG